MAGIDDLVGGFRRLHTPPVDTIVCVGRMQCTWHVLDSERFMQEPGIFTKHVKPFFAYQDPAAAKIKIKSPPPPGTTVRIESERYRHVEPKQEFTQALLSRRGPIQPGPSSRNPDGARLPPRMFTPAY